MTLESKEVAKAIKSLKQQGLIVSPKACYYIPADS
jgi:biotin operon repressor